MEINSVIEKYLTEKVDKRKMNKAERMIKKLGFHMIKNADTADNQIRVSMEEGDGAGDYYDQGAYGDWGIAKSLHKVAKQMDSYWEWENPAVISMYID